VETVMAQICAEALGVDYRRVRVVHGQTERIARGIGAHAAGAAEAGAPRLAGRAETARSPRPAPPVWTATGSVSVLELVGHADRVRHRHHRHGAGQTRDAPHAAQGSVSRANNAAVASTVRAIVARCAESRPPVRSKVEITIPTSARRSTESATDGVPGCP